jgi:hypothetical protein
MPRELVKMCAMVLTANGQHPSSGGGGSLVYLWLAAGLLVLEKVLKTQEIRAVQKRPCCVSWADKTQVLSHDQTRQGSVLCLTNTSTLGIQKQDHQVGKR